MENSRNDIRLFLIAYAVILSFTQGRLRYPFDSDTRRIIQRRYKKTNSAGFSVSVTPTNFIKSFPIRFRRAKGSRFLVIIFYFATLTLINNLLFPDISRGGDPSLVEVWPNPLPPFILQLRSTFDFVVWLLTSLKKEILGSSSRSRTIFLFLRIQLEFKFFPMKKFDRRFEIYIFFKIIRAKGEKKKGLEDLLIERFREKRGYHLSLSSRWSFNRSKGQLFHSVQIDGLFQQGLLNGQREGASKFEGSYSSRCRDRSVESTDRAPCYASTIKFPSFSFSRHREGRGRWLRTSRI